MPAYGRGINYTAADNSPVAVNQLTTGQETFPRQWTAGQTLTCSNQSFRVCYFTAYKNQTVASLRVVTGSTAAGATPTLIRYGLYSVGSDGALTGLLASTANDTTLLASTNTGYTKALSASYDVIAGTRYACGILVVTGATAPAIMGGNWGVAAQSAVAPRLGAFVSGQSDLPASVVAGSLSDTGAVPYFALL